MSKKKITAFFALFFTIVGLLTLIIILFFTYNKGQTIYTKTGLDLNKGSDLGDFVGGFVGVFFTIAGVLLLYRTLQLQGEEFAKTQKAITQQQFETTLFNMLQVLHNLVISTNGNVKGQNESGYKYFQSSLNDLITRLEQNQNFESEGIKQKVIALDEILTTDFQNLESHNSDIYRVFYLEHQAELGHYFRYLYNIIKYVLDKKFEPEAQKKYLNLVQAQLSNQELGLIFYNVNSEFGKNSEGFKQFKDWLDEYSLLENLDPSSLQDKFHHILFKKTIFKFHSLDEANWKRQGMGQHN
jgi:hypothetical protein